MSSARQYTFEVVQAKPRGIVLASVTGPDEVRAFWETMHYARQYALDELVLVRAKPKRRTRKRSVRTT